jgi:hypothetical protein
VLQRFEERLKARKQRPTPAAQAAEE